jgi:hypothetical protein
LNLEVLELSAWRFLASHRVGALCATHVQFIDGDECRANTPSCLEFYESAGGKTFGEAAIRLALALGMPCPIGCDGALGAFAQAKSTAPTANAGTSGKPSRRTRSRSVDSTTAATGAEARTDASAAQNGGSK